MTKKKIGIFTWWDNANYGGFLQALATQTYLRKIGCDVEMVDLQIDEFLYYRKTFCEWLIFIVKHLLFGYPLQTLFRLYNTHKVITEYLRKSQFVLRENHTEIEWKKLNCYDILLCGSDQIWNPNYIKEEYLLKNSPNGILKLSYATSVGVSQIPDEKKKIYKKYLNDFQAVSCRELSGSRELSYIIGRDIKWVVDPTLLLDADEWKKVLNIKEKPSNVMLVYLLSEDIDTYLSLFALAKKYRKKIHLYVNHNSIVGFSFRKKNLRYLAKSFCWKIKLFFSNKIKICKKADAKNFIEELYNSDMIFSDSFHALIFSVIFDKNVKIYFPDCRKNISSRMNDFASNIGMKNVFIKENIDDSCFDISAKYNVDKLSEWISESKKWLQFNIGNTVC